MTIEYEATFEKINKDDVRARLKAAGAKLEKSEFMQKRHAFVLPAGHEIDNGWARVRDEGDKITMSVKVNSGGKIDEQKEECLVIQNYETGNLFLELLGCRAKSYQETKRELWLLDGVEITIDEWPFLEPFVEVEGKSEEEVRVVSEKLGFDWARARFIGVSNLYNEKYGLSCNAIDNHTPKIVFDMENPFVGRENE